MISEWHPISGQSRTLIVTINAIKSARHHAQFGKSSPQRTQSRDIHHLCYSVFLWFSLARLISQYFCKPLVHSEKIVRPAVPNQRRDAFGNSSRSQTSRRGNRLLQCGWKKSDIRQRAGGARWRQRFDFHESKTFRQRVIVDALRYNLSRGAVIVESTSREA